MSLLDISFSRIEVDSFLERIDCGITSPSIQQLSSIVSGIIEHIPFQNISMLTNEWIRPTNKLIKHDMLSGLGGLCTVRNPFLHEFLKCLGYKVRFASSTMIEPDCHITLIVELDGNDWWVDVGNGYPYMEPIMLGDQKEKSNWFMKYKLVQKSGRYHVYHKINDGDWELNHHFSAKGVDFSAFDRMHHLHYSVPGWGPFLTGLRVNRFWKNGGVIIRNERASSPEGTCDLKTDAQLGSWLNKWFTKSGFVDRIDVSKANFIWKEEKRKWDIANKN